MVGFLWIPIPEGGGSETPSPFVLDVTRLDNGLATMVFRHGTHTITATRAGWDDAIPWTADDYEADRGPNRFGGKPATLPMWEFDPDPDAPYRTGIQLHVAQSVGTNNPISYGSFGCLVADAQFLQQVDAYIKGTGLANTLEVHVVDAVPTALTMQLRAAVSDVTEGQTATLIVELSQSISKDAYVLVKLDKAGSTATANDLAIDKTGLHHFVHQANAAGGSPFDGYYVFIAAGSTTGTITVNTTRDQLTEDKETAAYYIADYAFNSPDSSHNDRFYSDSGSPKTLVRISPDTRETIFISDQRDLCDAPLSMEGGIEGLHHVYNAEGQHIVDWSFEAYTVPDSLTITVNGQVMVATGITSGFQQGSFTVPGAGDRDLDIVVIGSADGTAWVLNVACRDEQLGPLNMIWTSSDAAREVIGDEPGTADVPTPQPLSVNPVIDGAGDYNGSLFGGADDWTVTLAHSSSWFIWLEPGAVAPGEADVSSRFAVVPTVGAPVTFSHGASADDPVAWLLPDQGETFSLQVQQVGGIPFGQYVLHVVAAPDVDGPAFAVATDSAFVGEDAGGEDARGLGVAIYRMGSTAGTVSVAWQIEGTGAHPVDAADFGGTLPSGVAVFQPGETIVSFEIFVPVDAVAELPEGMRLVLGQPSDGFIVDPATGEHGAVTVEVLDAEGLPVQATATADGDYIVGTDAQDSIHGLAGNDIIESDDADDSLYGDGGNDQLLGGEEDDTLYGGDGDDVLDAGSTATIGQGGDVLYGGQGSDSLIGGAGNDHLFGEDGFDWLAALAAPFVFVDLQDGTAFGSGNDIIASIEGVLGGAHNDGIFGDGHDNVLLGGGGADVIDGRGGTNWIEGGAGADVVSGGADTDVLFGDSAVALPGAGGDSVYGGAGSDYVNGGAGDDDLYGGGGFDWLEAESGDDTVFGDSGGDFINGQAGNDVAFGGDGDGDAFFGFEGNDTLYGGDAPGLADDWLWGDDFDGTIAGNDTLYGGSGIDVLFAGAGNDLVYGGGDADYIDALSGDDRVFGDAGADWLVVGTGNDTVDAGADNDVVGGDVGDDLLYGGSGTDVVWGGVGDDIIDLGAGDGDFAYGDAGNDTLVIGVGAGWDQLADWNGGDRIDLRALGITGFGAITVAPAAGGAVVSGPGLIVNVALDAGETLGAGDFLFASGPVSPFSSGSDTVTLNSGDDTADALAGADTVDGSAGNDTLHGNDGADLLLGSTGNDLLLGEADNDLLYGGDGRDELYGAAGDDSLGGGTAFVIFTDTFGNTLYGGAGNDTAIGGQLADVVYGGSDSDGGLIGVEGADIIYGEAGDDRIYGSSGGAASETAGNTLFGGDGTDTVHGSQLDAEVFVDTIYGGADADTLYGAGGADLLFGGAGNDLIYGGAGNDTVDYAGQSGTVIGSGALLTVSLAGGEVDTLYDVEAVAGLAAPSPFTAGGDTLVLTPGDDVGDALAGDDVVGGAAGNDTLDGNEGKDTLRGETGTDTLSGANGADTLYGGEGNDLYYGGSDDDWIDDLDGGSDRLYGGSGNDFLETGVLDGAGQIDTAFGDSGDDTILGDEGFDDLYGGTGNDSLTGFELDDTLFGGAGDDRMSGSVGDDFIDDLDGGNDELFGGDGNDFLETGFLNGATQLDVAYGGTGSDLVYGDEGNDFLFGGDDADTLVGYELTDVLYGGAGADTLRGHTGDDTLYGGAGNDTFAFSPGSGFDRVGDWDDGADRLDLTDFGYANFAGFVAGGGAIADPTGATSARIVTITFATGGPAAQIELDAGEAIDSSDFRFV